MAAADEADYLSGPIGAARLRPAPATSLIPERSVAGRRSRFDDDLDHRDIDGDRDFDDAPSTVLPATDGGSRGGSSGPATGGGRATRRAELQAADHARKEAAKRNGTPIVSPLDEEGAPRRSRVLMGLAAMVVVALGVLGVYQLTSPADEAAAQNPVATTTAPVPDVGALPTLPTLAPAPVEPKVDPNAKAPVTVLNATQITGLAKKVADSMAAAGWQTPAVGSLTGADIAASTVYFTEGDEAQRQAAVNLVDQFPQLIGPAPRFFDVPAGIDAPGLVVVTTGDWTP
jgi:hypothetical protein